MDALFVESNPIPLKAALSLARHLRARGAPPADHRPSPRRVEQAAGRARAPRPASSRGRRVTPDELRAFYSRSRGDGAGAGDAGQWRRAHEALLDALESGDGPRGRERARRRRRGRPMRG